MSLLQSEFSIRLVGAPAEVTAYRASLQGPKALRGEWSRNTTRFFDTATGALRSAGLELAIAETAGAVVEKISLTPDHAFPLLRQSFTRAVAKGAAPGAVTGVSVIDTRLGTHSGNATETARLEAESWKAVVMRPDVVAQIEILQGALETRDSRTPVSEIRIDLLKGARAAFFDLVEEALTGANGRLQISAPADFLTAGYVPKARKVRFADTDNAADVLAASLGAAAARLMELAPFLAKERSSEAARQMRVALRRFRTLERVFRRDLKARTFRDAVDRARGLGRAIGAARDWEIFLEDTLCADVVSRYDPHGVAHIEALAKDWRGECWDRAVAAVESEEFSRLVIDLLRGAYCQEWRARAQHLEAPILGFAQKALDRRLAKADAVADAINPDCPEMQHELRLALKKLRYTAQMFRDLYDKTARKPYFAAMSQLQDKFGALNDAVSAQERCTELAKAARDEVAPARDRAARTLGFILGWRGAAGDDASRHLAEAWRTFRQEPPYWRLPYLPSADYIDATEPIDGAAPPHPPDESEQAPDAEDPDHSLP